MTVSRVHAGRGASPRTARAINDRLALRLLQREGPLTAGRLRDLIGMSRPSVADLVDRLRESGLIEVVGEAGESNRGPNARVYGIVADRAYVAGLDVRLDSVRVEIADLLGRTVARALLPVPQDADPAATVQDGIGLLRGAARDAGVDALHTVAFGAPGMIDPVTGRIRTTEALPGWHGDLVDEVRKRFGVPVLLENEVNLAAVAEQRARAEGGADAGGPAADGRAAGERAAGGRDLGGPDGSGPDAGDRGARGRSADDRASDDRPAYDRPDRPAYDRPARRGLPHERAGGPRYPEARADEREPDAETFALLWLGAGVGAAIVLDGRLRRGVSGGAGEVGFLPISPDGALPTATDCDSGYHGLVGGRAVRALADRHGVPVAVPAPAGSRKRDDDADAAAAAVRAALAAGPAGEGFLDELAGRIALGAAAMCAVLDPGQVVLAGEVGQAGGSALADRVADRLAAVSPLHTAVVPTVAGAQPILRGAVVTAMDAAQDDLFSPPG